MEASKGFYRKATAESPLTVYYFTPTHIDSKPAPLHRSNAFMVLLMHGGELEFHHSGGILWLTRGDILLVPPRKLQAFRSTSMQTCYTLFCMNPELFSLPAAHFFSREFWQPLQHGKLRPPQLLQPGVAPYEELLTQMLRLDEKKEGTADYTMELVCIAMNICCALFPHCSREQVHEVVRTDSQTVSDKCMQYIRTNYQQRITLEDIAHHVHLHPNYLCALFREQTGKTVFEQLVWQRVHEASKLLRGSDLPISQVSSQCGFQSPSFFARKFKQILGITPTACRKKSQGK